MTPRRLTLRGVEFFKLKIRISPRKRIFKQNYFSPLAQMGLIHEIKYECPKSRDTATLSSSDVIVYDFRSAIAAAKSYK